MLMRREAFLDRVQERGEYQTREEVERVARVSPCWARTWSTYQGSGAEEYDPHVEKNNFSVMPVHGAENGAAGTDVADLGGDKELFATSTDLVRPELVAEISADTFPTRATARSLCHVPRHRDRLQLAAAAAPRPGPRRRSVPDRRQHGKP